MTGKILLIGPKGTGKSTQAALLALALGWPRLALDEVCWSFYAELPEISAATAQIEAEHGADCVLVRGRLWFAQRLRALLVAQAGAAGARRIEECMKLHAVRRALAVSGPAVIDFGAGHSIYDLPDILAAARALLSPCPHVILLLPADAVEDSVAILRGRVQGGPNPVPDEHLRAQLLHPANRALSRHTLVAAGAAPEEIRDRILHLTAADIPLTAGSGPPRFVSPLLTRGSNPLRRLAFGQVEQAPGVAAIQGRLNQALLAVCRSLPAALRDDAEAIVTGYGRRTATDAGDFFRLFYTPLWSWIHWVAAEEQQEALVAGHAMAMFLHLLDDHLSDGQLQTDPLLLQLRTAAWTELERAAAALSGGVEGGRQMVQAQVERYFAAIYRGGQWRGGRHAQVTTLDAYCTRFCDQMATWVIIPILAALRRSGAEAAADLRQVLEALGVAWRLIDDLQDTWIDLIAGEETIVPLLLDPEGRALWQRCRTEVTPGPSGQLPDGPAWQGLVAHLFRSGLVEQLLGRIRAELARAESLCERRGWSGMAEEFRQMARPLEDQAPVRSG